MIFCNDDISKFKSALVLKDLFSETTNMRVLNGKFEVSSIILTSFRQGVILTPTPTTSKHTVKSKPRLG